MNNEKKFEKKINTTTLVKSTNRILADTNYVQVHTYYIEISTPNNNVNDKSCMFRANLEKNTKIKNLLTDDALKHFEGS